MLFIIVASRHYNAFKNSMLFAKGIQISRNCRSKSSDLSPCWALPKSCMWKIRFSSEWTKFFGLGVSLEKSLFFLLLKFGSNSLSLLVGSRFYNPWVSQWQALLVEGRILGTPMYSTSFPVHPLTQYQKNLALSLCKGLNIMASYCSYKRCKKTYKNVMIFKSQKRNINHEYLR